MLRVFAWIVLACSSWFGLNLFADHGRDDLTNLPVSLDGGLRLSVPISAHTSLQKYGMPCFLTHSVRYSICDQLHSRWTIREFDTTVIQRPNGSYVWITPEGLGISFPKQPKSDCTYTARVGQTSYILLPSEEGGAHITIVSSIGDYWLYQEGRLHCSGALGRLRLEYRYTHSGVCVDVCSPEVKAIYSYVYQDGHPILGRTNSTTYLSLVWSPEGELQTITNDGAAWNFKYMNGLLGEYSSFPNAWKSLKWDLHYPYSPRECMWPTAATIAQIDETSFSCTFENQLLSVYVSTKNSSKRLLFAYKPSENILFKNR